MRKGRFAGLSDRSREASAPLGLADLLLFDFRTPVDEDAERLAVERVRLLTLSLPLLAAADILWSSILLFALHASGAAGQLIPVGSCLITIVLLDLSLWFALRKGPKRPQAVARWTAVQAAARAAIWIGAALLCLSGPSAATVLVRAALVAGAGAGVALFFAMPLLMLFNSAATLTLVALVAEQRPLVPVALAIGLFLAWLSLARCRHQLSVAREHLSLKWEAEKARRFVADFEASGRGWFWETNADGALTYLSAGLAGHCGSEPLPGTRFTEYLLAEEAGGGEARRSLDFHLSARFPFTDLVVRAATQEETWWSLSGKPNFDSYGRFLGFRGIGSNLSEERRSEAETSKLARYDSLTGLPNRAMMRSMLDEALANADARRRGCALMMIDLDKFKQVNDTLGHPVGDKLLKEVAQRLADVLGEDGQAGRLGGDEFEAILPGIEEEGRLSAIAGRLIEEVSRPYCLEGQDVRIGASVGIAVARPGKTYAAALIKDADLALYAAKAGGRGTYRFFASEMHSQAAERQILETELRQALVQDQLRLFYQPIVDAISEEVVAFEALLRWQHPTRGLLLPALIIPLADETGLMPRIGDWVIRTACADASKWPRHVRVAVNLSPSQLADPSLPATVTGALAASTLDPERLELEISEGVLLGESASVEPVLARLHGLGVRLALDNFGTGRAGLGHLRDAPLDKIKIDRSFVRGAGEPGSRNAAIVRSIVVLAESLGMDTTAEGAETIEELQLIRRLGCSQVQGFIFGKPLPAAETLALARRSKPSGESAGFSRPPRYRLIRTGTLSADGRGLPVRLRNISEGGAMIEGERAFEAGTPVELDLDEAGRLYAEVRWSRQGQTGLRFGEAFDLKKLSRPRAGAAGLKMLTPQYLERAPEPEAAPASSSPLATKKRRAR